MIENSLNIHGDEILYVGDHIYTDVSQSKVHLRWRTALICRELEEEVSHYGFHDRIGPKGWREDYSYFCDVQIFTMSENPVAKYTSNMKIIKFQAKGRKHVAFIRQ